MSPLCVCCCLQFHLLSPVLWKSDCFVSSPALCPRGCSFTGEKEPCVERYSMGVWTVVLSNLSTAVSLLETSHQQWERCVIFPSELQSSSRAQRWMLMASCRACCPLCLFWSTRRNLLLQESIFCKVCRGVCAASQRVYLTPSGFWSYWGFPPKKLQTKKISLYKKAAGAVLLSRAVLVLALAVARHSLLLQHWGPQHSC